MTYRPRSDDRTLADDGQMKDVVEQFAHGSAFRNLSTSLKEASSEEFVGEFWLWQRSKIVIQRGFIGILCSEAVRFSGYQFYFVVEPLDNARRQLALGAKPVQQQCSFGT